MKLQDYLDRTDEADIHLTEIKYFTVTSAQSDEYYITEHRMVYHKATLWGDHPWGQHDGDRGPGADFLRDWTHEDRLHDSPYESCNGPRFRAQGRWTGWEGPRAVLKRPGHYGTLAEAEAAMREQVERAYQRVKEQFKALRRTKLRLAEKLEEV